MKCFLFGSLILVIVSPAIGLSQPLKIPVIPYDEKPSHVSNKLHNRCKHFKDYYRCIDKYEQRIITSLEMDY